MARFLHIFGDVLVVFWVLVLLFVGHVRWGQYFVDPSRRVVHHVRHCEACKSKVETAPAWAPYTEWFCPEGARLYDRYGIRV